MPGSRTETIFHTIGSGSFPVESKHDEEPPASSVVFAAYCVRRYAWRTKIGHGPG